MKSRNRTGHLKRSQSAFTLAEMLVSISVLAVLLLLTAQLTVRATGIITTTLKRTDADSAARIALDRISLDVGRMIKRSDIDYSFNKTTGNDSLAFFAEATGYYERAASAPSYSRRRPLSALIAYQASPTTSSPTNVDLRRLSQGIVWADDNSDTAAYFTLPFLPLKIVGSPGIYANASALYNSNSADYKVISDQVFRFEFCFLMKDGTLSNQPWLANSPYSHTELTLSDISAVVVAIAVIDRTSRNLVGDLTKLRDALPDVDAGSDIAAKWIDVVNNRDAANPFPPASIPQVAGGAVRIYQRYCYLGKN